MNSIRRICIIFFLLIATLSVIAGDNRVRASQESTSSKLESAYPPLAPHETLSFPSNYNGTVFVIDDGEYRMLRFGSELSNYTQSKVKIKNPSLLLYHYTKCAMMGLLLFKNTQKDLRNVLMIGLGGGSITRFLHANYPDTSIDIVELDPVVVAIARKYFFVAEDEKVRVITADGRKFLEESTKNYDAIILDAFNESGNVPRQLSSVEWLRCARKRLNGKGILIMNFVNNDIDSYRSTLATYHHVFKHIVRFNMDSLNKSNVILIATDDDAKHISKNGLLVRAAEYSKLFYGQINFSEYIRICNGDHVKWEGAAVIHDE